MQIGTNTATMHLRRREMNFLFTQLWFHSLVNIHVIYMLTWLDMTRFMNGTYKKNISLFDILFLYNDYIEHSLDTFLEVIHSLSIINMVFIIGSNLEI